MNKILLLLVVIASIINAQALPEIKKAAENHMSAGRYGEAIELLNKYVAANPRRPDGYFLRGQCFEKRGQNSNARFDYRNALKLNTKDAEVKKTLDALIERWYKEINRKIEGRKREIAINPARAENYLEIGKAYRDMEMFPEAEAWYDEYLKRDDNASPDEIIRFSEILAENKHLVKGEKILKKWVDRYPEDWRLRSRYGYFLLWLGKYVQAKNEFEAALKIKPYFKEAEDGLDLAMKKGYIITYTGGKEFEIDRYFRELRANPDDNSTRLKLIDALLKHKRIEEAYWQSKILTANDPENDNYFAKAEYVDSLRRAVYQKSIEENLEKYNKNPLDKKALSTALDNLVDLKEYGRALDLIEDYFNRTGRRDAEYLFLRAKIYAWVDDYDKAINNMEELLKSDPGNPEYQLFLGQLYVWKDDNLERASVLLNDAEKSKSDDFPLIIAKGLLNVLMNNYEEADKYIAKAEKIDPLNEDLDNLKDRYDIEKARFIEEKNYEILEKGRVLVVDGKCREALPYYEEFFSLTSGNVILLREYADVLACTGNYEKAFETYDSVLAKDYTYETDLERAKLHYAHGDSLKALEDLKRLSEEDPENFEAKMYLGDAYVKLKDYDNAAPIYDSLLTWPLDSLQRQQVLNRQKWMPVTNIFSMLENFPLYSILFPTFRFYSDNADFKYYSFGLRYEFGLLTKLSGAVSVVRDIMKGRNGDQKFTTIKGMLFYKFNKNWIAGAGFGRMTSDRTTYKYESELFVKYEKEKRIKIQADYLKSNSSQILYSGYMLDRSVPVNFFKIEADYLHPRNIIIKGHYKFINVIEAKKNDGEDFLLRFGKKFDSEIDAGYEFNYINYKYQADISPSAQRYYSPKDYESHSAWMDWKVDESKDILVVLGGRIGYVIRDEFLIREVYTELNYQISAGALLTGRLTIGSTSRESSRYNYSGGIVTVSWSL